MQASKFPAAGCAAGRREGVWARTGCCRSLFCLYFCPGRVKVLIVKSLARWIAFVLLSGSAVLPAPAAFSSLYVFGDGVCTTTASPNPPSLFYGSRYCNGRVWVEVLAQRQGLTLSSSQNESYFGQTSTNLLDDVSSGSFTLPVAATNWLFVVRVCDADFVGDIENLPINSATWNKFINGSLTNHFRVVTNLYAKGARTLIMPNAVDLTMVPQYYENEDKTFIRQKIAEFNTALATTVANQIRARCPGITIYIPDFFALFDSMLASPATYGLVNPTPGCNAILDGYTSLSSGLGVSYIFWDDTDPTAKAQAVMADVAQRMISPATIRNVVSLGASNRLDVVNVPVGLSGYVEGRTNVVTGSWSSATNFNSTSVSQAIYVPTSGPRRFYRLRFPFAWTWP